MRLAISLLETGAAATNAASKAVMPKVMLAKRIVNIRVCDLLCGRKRSGG